jgi:hypothetical protein
MNKFEFSADNIQLNQPNKLKLNANPNSLQAVGNTNKNKKVRYSAGVYYQYFVVNNAFNGAKKNIDELDIGLDYNEKATQSFSTGLVGSINVNNWILSTGFGLNKVSFNGLFTIPFSTPGIAARLIRISPFLMPLMFLLNNNSCKIKAIVVLPLPLVALS